MAVAVVWLVSLPHLVLPSWPGGQGVIPTGWAPHHPHQAEVACTSDGPLPSRLRGGHLNQRSSSPGGSTVTSFSGSGIAFARNGSPSDALCEYSTGKSGELMPSRGGSTEATSGGGSGDGSVMSVDWSSYSAADGIDGARHDHDYHHDHDEGAASGTGGVLHFDQPRSSSPVSSIEDVQQPFSWDSCDRLMTELVRLFENRNGRRPSEEEVRQWGATFREAAAEQARERAQGRQGPSTVHISGVLVDLASGRVGVVRKKRRVGSRGEGNRMQCRHEGCIKRGSFVAKEGPGKGAEKSFWCSEHAPSGCVPEHAGKKSEPKHAFVSRLCAFMGCQLTPSFGELPTGARGGTREAGQHSSGTVMFCKQHKLPHHVNLRQPLCQHGAGCSKQAIFGEARLRKKIRCSAHRRACDVNREAPHAHKHSLCRPHPLC